MFSVLIPSYNHRSFLTDCTLSALRSPLVSEVLLVDDGSSDGSPELFELLQRFGPKIRVLPSPPGENLGAHARLNQLVEAATCDWVAPLNSDDLFVSGRFEAIQRIAARHEADLLFGDLVLIDGQGSRLGLRGALRHNELPWPATWDVAAMAHDKHWLPLLLLQNITATTTNMVFTRELHAAVGGFRDLRYCHDWDFMLRAAMQARLHYAPAMLAAYRLHGGNTIKEGGGRVNREVRQMLAGLVRESPAICNDPALMRTLAVNHYITPIEPVPLAVVMADPLSRGLLRKEVTDAKLPVHVVSATTEVPDDTAYVYQPGQAGTSALRLNDLRQVLLALALRSFDALLLRRAERTSCVDGNAELADALVLRRGAAGRWRTGALWQLRLYPLADQVGLSTVANWATDLALGSAPASTGVRIPLAASLLNRDRRPTVFILPAFLAVGGVERLVVETMRHLGERWRFVVVTTEPLQPEQGSMHAEVLPLAPVYDLAEVAALDDRLAAMEMLKDWHAPALVWIVNGAPWQVDHAGDIRRLFHDIPIVDHQAYDHEAGWITRYGDSGVRAADRFVAINQKIRAAMQERFAIPLTRIDLVYHGSDMARVRRRNVDAETVADHRRGFGLDPARPVFGMIGRLTAQKRPLDLVALAKRIGDGTQFVWVGLGELQAEVQTAMDKLANAILIPARSDLRPIYEMLDGLVITSEFEGLPIVLIEALAMGVPALSTDVGAIGEVLDRYGSGMVFGPPGDIEALERAFLAFQTTLPTWRRAAVEQSAQVTEDFSAARMAKKYETCFRQAIDEFEPVS